MGGYFESRSVFALVFVLRVARLADSKGSVLVCEFEDETEAENRGSSEGVIYRAHDVWSPVQFPLSLSHYLPISYT